MARVLGLEEVDGALRSAVASALRLTDEAIVLPSASRSDESGSFKNVVFRLRGDEPDLDPGVFECSLFTGLSAVAVEPKPVAASANTSFATPSRSTAGRICAVMGALSISPNEPHTGVYTPQFSKRRATAASAGGSCRGWRRSC